MTFNRSDTTPEKLLAMFMSAKVQADQTGLDFTMPGGIIRFIEVEPLVFRELKKDNHLVFGEDENGRITHASYDPYSLTTLIKSRWFETPDFNLPLIGVGSILFLSFLIVIPVTFFIQRKRANPTPSPHLERPARWIAGIVSLLNLLILVSAFASNFNIYGLYVGELPLWTVVSPLTIVSALLTIAMVVFTALAWVQRFWGLIERIHYTLVTLATVSFVWFMSFWNLLGKSF
jgi:hypothetical protein